MTKMTNLKLEFTEGKEQTYEGYDCYDTQLSITYNIETKEIRVGTFEKEYDFTMDINAFDNKLLAGEIQFFKK